MRDKTVATLLHFATPSRIRVEVWALRPRGILIDPWIWQVRNVLSPVRRYARFLWGFSAPQGRVSAYEYPRHHLTVRVLADLTSSGPISL
jgi:hypothetical protein